MLRLGALAVTLALTGLAACGGEDDGGPRERADGAATPPPGWRTVRNADAGFTLAVPRDWTTRVRRGATLIRTRDRLVTVTVAADRSATGREAEPSDYARRVLEALPEFEGSLSPRSAGVRGSPYPSGRVDGSGSLRTTRNAPQRITVVAFGRPRRVTYSVVVFRNARYPGVDEREIRQMLRSFRAQPGRQRSGRSG